MSATSTNRCATCQHRGNDPVQAAWEENERTPTFYQCKRVAHDKQWDYPQGQQAVVIDGSGYRAALCVEDSFGCILWEAKS